MTASRYRCPTCGHTCTVRIPPHGTPTCTHRGTPHDHKRAAVMVEEEPADMWNPDAGHGFTGDDSIVVTGPRSGRAPVLRKARKAQT